MKQTNWLGEEELEEPKMTKKLFVVEVMTELVVLADDEAEAEELARDSKYDGDWECDFSAREMTYLPNDWELRALPYGHRDDDDPDRTIEEWVKLGAAPKYSARKAQLNK